MLKPDVNMAINGIFNGKGSFCKLFILALQEQPLIGQDLGMYRTTAWRFRYKTRSPIDIYCNFHARMIRVGSFFFNSL